MNLLKVSLMSYKYQGGSVIKKHTVRQYNDEYHCSCGITWDVKEDDPHPAKKDHAGSVTLSGDSHNYKNLDNG